MDRDEQAGLGVRAPGPSHDAGSDAALLRNVLSHAPLILFALDRDGIFTLSTGMGLAGLGLEEGQVVGHSVYDVYAEYPAVMEINRKALAGQSVRDWVRVGSLAYDVRIEPTFDDNGDVAGASGIAVDITEQRALEDQLRQSQKLDAIGQLAGGIAHDFNNILTAISGHAEFLREGISPREDLQVHVDEIVQGVDQAASLTQRLLAFSRREIVRPETMDVNEILAGVEILLNRLTPENVRIVVQPSPVRCWVRASRLQLEQAVINLVLNARDAMPDGGTVLITTKQQSKAPDPRTSSPEPSPGPYVVVSVHDAGMGIDPEIREHVFEPFFTTKGVAASGLGLSTVYGIVSQWRGAIEMESEPGHGTTFRIYLPKVGAPGSLETLPTDGALDDTRVLVIEDNALVRDLTVRVLERAGMSVLHADSAEAAREVVSHASRGQLDLLVSDVMLPGQSGTLFAQELRAAFPELLVLFMSGYPLSSESKEHVSDERVWFLQKPFTPRELLTVVRTALDPERAPAKVR